MNMNSTCSTIATKSVEQFRSVCGIFDAVGASFVMRSKTITENYDSSNNIVHDREFTVVYSYQGFQYRVMYSSNSDVPEDYPVDLV